MWVIIIPYISDQEINQNAITSHNKKIIAFSNSFLDTEIIII